MQSFSQVYRKFGLLLATTLVLVGCVSAPVQEMSDARQAIRSAREAGAEVYSPDKLKDASEFLEKAERDLRAGSYFEAKRHAIRARKRAIRAREKADREKAKAAE